MDRPAGATRVIDRHVSAHERATADRDFTAWIAGSSHPTDDTIPSIDPVIDEPITAVGACSESDIDTAVEAAWDAYESTWSDTTPRDRSERLHAWADTLEAHRDELTQLDSLDCGKPITQARGEVDGAIDTLRYYASICRAQRSDRIPAGRDLHLYTKHEPYGVVGQIIPWNFPLWAMAWKLGPALAAGNTTVLKPSSTAPLTTIRAAQLSKDVLPDGVLNVVPGSGSTVGSAISGHAAINKVSFTGSTAVGREIGQATAAQLTPLTLELGGKSPFIVFPDANLEKVVDAVASGIFYSTGEICDAFSRVLVHESVAAEFTERFVERAESYVLGDPLDEDTTMGPISSKSQYDSVTGYIETGREEATLLCGGGRPDDSDLAAGWYVEPTVFGDVSPEATIATEEIFGPVQTILTFEGYDEAIELANDTPYGLAAGIGTERTSIVHTAADDLDAGLIYVNEYGPILPEAPYGGFKDSGFGKDLGIEALDHYRRTKSVYVNLDEPSL